MCWPEKQKFGHVEEGVKYVVESTVLLGDIICLAHFIRTPQKRWTNHVDAVLESV